MTFYEELIGIPEDENAITHFTIDDNKLTSTINHKRYTVGWLQTPTLQELKNRKNNYFTLPNEITEVVANIKDLYCDPNNSEAVFQVASQFNLLEMANPNLTPQHGVSIYEYDNTQGPISAICCGAATIHRNYMQIKEQINCLSEIEIILNNKNNNYWTIQNGYTMLNMDKLPQLNEHIEKIGRETLKYNLKVGTLQHTQVTINNLSHLVNQVFCSAIPISYNTTQSKWAEVDPIFEPLASLILEAAYEATLLFSIRYNFINNNITPVFLTLLGGGAFGNEPQWIYDAIQHALGKYENHGLDIRIVSYGNSNPDIQYLLT